MMITQRQIDQTFSDLRSTCGGVREDYFGLLYLEKEHNLVREKAVNQVAFGGHDYKIDGFHFDEQRGNLYLFQFKYSESYAQFNGSRNPIELFMAYWPRQAFVWGSSAGSRWTTWTLRAVSY